MNVKKITALSIALVSVLNVFSVSAFAKEEKSYKITNPYETVDFNTYKQYKAQLHAHTLYSDGEMDIKDVVEEYYAQDYDILAIADHGVVNQGWNKVPEMLPIIGFNQYLGELTPVSEERYKEITTGADRDNRPMLDVNQGIEMNGCVMRKNHVNGFFCGYGQGEWGVEEDYETPVKGTEEMGGLSFINHPGDFNASNRDVNRAYDPEFLKIFTDIFMEYDSCVGVEAFNRIDSASRADRIIWDNILMYTVPRGRNVWGFSNDDSHILTDIGLTAEIMLMPELSNDALRTAMENGTFFACSTIARNEMGEDFTGNGNYAKVNNIIVDEKKDIITVEATNYEVIEWVSDGEVIAKGSSFNLKENSESLGSYVRFQIKNEGGIVLSQPFICDDGDMESKIINYPEEAPKSFIENVFDTVVEKLRKTLLGELIYRAVCL